jgi:hypothetical protein
MVGDYHIVFVKQGSSGPGMPPLDALTAYIYIYLTPLLNNSSLQSLTDTAQSFIFLISLGFWSKETEWFIWSSKTTLEVNRSFCLDTSLDIAHLPFFSIC